MPEQVTCMKKGNLTEEAFDKVKEIWYTEPRSNQNETAQNQIEVDDEETECNEVKQPHS